MMSQQDTFYMQMALQEAHNALQEDEVPIGCVIVCENQIIGRGHNMTERLKDATSHAEMQAITAACATLGGKYLQNCTLYVTVEPCVMCAGAIAWTQIKRLVYGTPDIKKGYTQLTNASFLPKCEVIKGVLGDECRELMQSFFEKKRKKYETIC